MIETVIQDKQIYITKTVVDIFCRFRQFDPHESERGGIVLGQITESENKVLVCRATIPTHADNGSRTSFYRNKAGAQQIIQYEFFNSERKNTYLGEWHTHPAKTAAPSSQDLEMIKDQFRSNDMKVNFIIMAIVAQEEVFLGLYNDNGLGSVVVSI